MLSAPLEHAFNNGSRGFAVCSRLPGCLSLFWVAYFLALLTTWITVWLCAAKPNSILETLLSAWMVFPSFWLCTGGPPITRLHGWQIKRLWHIQHNQLCMCKSRLLIVWKNLRTSLEKFPWTSFVEIYVYIFPAVSKLETRTRNWLAKKIWRSYVALSDPKFRTGTKSNFS